MSLSKSKVIDDFNFFKKRAIYNSNKKNIKKAVVYTELTAKIGYNFNFKYSDNELENNILKIATSIINTKISFDSIPDRIVFHDSFSIDNRGLTQQYLRAIFSWNSDLLYIANKNTIGEQILKELNHYPKSKILILSEESFEKNFLFAKDEIIKFKPSKAFLHFSPWEILGIALWSQITSVERFLINLTDHAFWLGKSCLDYIIEFRNYGCYLSENERGILKEKILYQPYYPIISSSIFNGFPISTNNKIIAFAGSSYYKVYGENFFLLKMIKEVLIENSNLLFLFAGSGDVKPIRRFIKENKLEQCFILIGYRSDISEVVKNIDIYVNTYPLMGGLMSQYAALMNKPIIGYSDEKLYDVNDTEDLLGISKRGILTRKTQKSFIDYFNELVRNIEIRNENIAYTKNALLQPKEFNQLLKKTIENKIQSLITSEIGVDKNKVFETYLDVENSYLNNYNNLLFSSLKLRMILIKPREFIQFFLKRFSERFLNTYKMLTTLHPSKKKNSFL